MTIRHGGGRAAIEALYCVGARAGHWQTTGRPTIRRCAQSGQGDPRERRHQQSAPRTRWWPWPEIPAWL